LTLRFNIIMNDNVALLVNLLTLAESGCPNFKLEISHTYYDSEDFVPRKKVKLNDVELFTVEFDHVLGAVKDWPVLKHDVLEKYMPPQWPGMINVPSINVRSQD